MAEQKSIWTYLREAWRDYWALGVKVKVASGLTVLLLAAALVAVGSSSSEDSPSKAKADSPAEVDARQEQKVENTPKPTNTPKPSSTPKPTETPKPTATPTAANAADLAYRAAYVSEINVISDQLSKFQQLAAASRFDAAWQRDMLAVVDNLAASATKLRDLPLPPGSAWAAFGAKNRQSMDKYIASMTLMRSGITNLNATAISDAAAQMTEATALLNEARALIPNP